MHTVDPERLKAELLRMKELIANDPRVLAHFDTDGNGVIDGQEWEAVRDLVVRRLEREAMEQELARRLFDQLDEEQAAELARMEAEMAEEHGQPEEALLDEAIGSTPGLQPEEAPEDRGNSVGGRDWSDLELAFDPREDKASRDTTMADGIFQKELASRYAGSARDPARVRLSEEGSLGDCSELILEQVGGAKQFFGNMFRREYLVREPDGEQVGRIIQSENEMMQNMTDFSILENPDLNFRVQDFITDETYTFRRTSGLTDNSVMVLNPKGRMIARTSWTLSFLRRKYEVRSVRESVSYYVRRRALRPWTFDILDPFEEPMGTMQRGWTGLGFLTGGNLFHIELEKPVSPDAMWGLLATALLADLDSEAGSRKSGLDFFNE